MSVKTIILPEKEEMLARLRKTEDPLQVQEGLYELLVKNAGEKKTAKQVAIMLQVNIYKYANWESSPALTQLHRNTSALLMHWSPTKIPHKK